MRRPYTIGWWWRNFPNLKEEVGSSIPGCEIPSMLDEKLAGWSSASCVLWRWPIGFMPPKNEVFFSKRILYMFTLDEQGEMVATLNTTSIAIMITFEWLFLWLREQKYGHGWVRPLAKPIPSVVNNLWWNCVMDDWTWMKIHLVSDNNCNTAKSIMSPKRLL